MSGNPAFDDAVQRLMNDAHGSVTGTPYPTVQGDSLFPKGYGQPFETQAMEFFTLYAAFFGLSDARQQLSSSPVRVKDPFGATHVTYTLAQQNLPGGIRDARFEVIFDKEGHMREANCEIMAQSEPNSFENDDQEVPVIPDRSQSGLRLAKPG